MSVVVEIGHPAHVHVFRHVIHELERRGHAVQVVARAKDVALRLLDDYGIPYISLSRQGKGVIGVAGEMLRRDWCLYRLARKWKPKVFLSVSSMAGAHVARCVGAASIILDDTEIASLERAAWLPFATVVLTPSVYGLNLGAKQRRYPGYHELAYLHPQRFTPDPSLLAGLDLSPKDPYAVVRFVSWRATHDQRQYGFTLAGKRRLVAALKDWGRVVITSEQPLPSDLEPFRMRISPTVIHHVLYYSKLYVGEGASMASEAGIMGTPSIYVNSITAGTLQEQEERYGLLRQVIREDGAIDLARSWMTRPGLRREIQFGRERMLAEKIDVTAWLVDVVEWYLR